MKISSKRLAALTGLLLWSILIVPAVFAAAPTLSLTINPAPPGGTTTATVAILDAADAESFSLELNFSTGTSLILPASGWFARGVSFPSVPFGVSVPVELNSAFESSTRKKVYLNGFRPSGSAGSIGAVTFAVSPLAATGASQYLTLSGEYFSKTTLSAGTFAPVTAVFESGNYPNITATPSIMSFGRVNAGSQSAAQTFTVNNSGSGVLNISTVSLGGSDPGEFQKLNDTCAAVSLQQGGNCTFAVVFKPTTTGTKTATIMIASNDPDTPSLGVPVRGNDFFTLTLTKLGTGEGTISSPLAGIACNTGCSAIFDSGTQVTLQADPAEFSLFNGWSTSCSGTGDCIIDMTGDRGVTATFDKDLAHMVRINSLAPSYFSILQAAYDVAPDDSVIEAWAVDFTGGLTINRNIAVELKGGFNSDYSHNTDATMLNGMLIIRNGKVTVERLFIK